MKTFVIVLSFLGAAASQNFNLQVCPSDWISEGDRCYHFVHYPLLPYDEAAKACQRDGAILLTIDDYAEHLFVVNRLKSLDPARREWYTSGERDITNSEFRYVWTATNVKIPLESQIWITPMEPINRDISRSILAYKFDFTRGIYGLAAVAERHQERPYICEISRSEVYRINIVDRSFDYGISFEDPNSIKRGPKFTVEARNTVILGYTPSVFLECMAFGIPSPTYSWTRNDVEQITTDTNSRYTITNGRLTIADPRDEEDAGNYQCRCENSEGVIVGHPVKLSFGTLGEFSNVPAAPVTPEEYQGAVIECPSIPSRMSEAVRYQWMREMEDGFSHEFVRPELNTYLFISGNGKLYFSEVTSADSGVYICVATLTSINQNQNYIGSSQMPSRNSRGIRLEVRNSGGGLYDPRIQDSFINVVPGTPVTGMDISLECFAYGTTPLFYKWSFHKWDNERYTFNDSNRVLNIRNVNLEDSGKFSCTVRSGRQSGNFDHRDYVLNVESAPEFLLPLMDKHLDIGTRQLTWRCEARAVPFPTYTWYKDGVKLKNSTDGDITIFKNTLILKNLKKERDEGMYQCAAANSYGERRSAAQLRILTIAPSFSKFPMSPTLGGAIGGEVTIQCRPEAAPYPTFSWFHNGGNLNPGMDSGSRISMAINGDLIIRDLSMSDQGQYECRVENEFGNAVDGTVLSVYEQTTIYQRPTPDDVLVNKTAFFYCRASFNRHNLDLTYQWAFNGRMINLNNHDHFRRGTPPENEGGLYITFAQFDHSGIYTCIATTQVDSANVSASLFVKGPPSEPAGVMAYLALQELSDVTNVGTRDIVLRWTDPVDTHGSPVDSYIIYGKTNYSDHWVTLNSYVPHPATVIPGVTQDSQRRQYLLQNLKPGVSYQFKLRAINSYGVGDESQPTRKTTIPGAAPIKAPDFVGGGGGKVGTLKISWTPLSPEDQNGWGIGYIVEWREKPAPGSQGNRWNKEIVYGSVGTYSRTMTSDTYFKPYNVKVTPFNIFGEGPSGFNDTVMSAEDMPNAIPKNVYAEPFNESAITVYWDPIPDTREAMKGRLRGYKIFYWLKDIQTQQDAIQAIVYGNVDHGRIIGLRPDTWYTVSVIVFNNAGNGLKSEVAHQSTDRSAPLDYPVNIEVYPHGENSVRVRFRGLSTGTYEEPLLGYKIRYWRDTDDIRNAKDVDCEKRTEGFLYQIQPEYLYHLRVLGYSMGGDGKMSSPETLFSYMRGRVTQVQWDPSTSEVKYVLNDVEDAGTSLTINFLCLLLPLLGVFLFL